MDKITSQGGISVMRVCDKIFMLFFMFLVSQQTVFAAPSDADIKEQ